jgi:hypothetical protein
MSKIITPKEAGEWADKVWPECVKQALAAPVPLTKDQRRAIHEATGSMRFYEAVEHAINKTEAAHGITKGQP